MPFIRVKTISRRKEGGRKRGGRGDKLRVRFKDLFSMECIRVSLPTLVLTKGSVFDCLSSKTRE